jgi:hypothetical protein
MSGVSKGTLSGSGPTYTLPISGFTEGGTLDVSVSKTGYDISGSPQSTTIYYYSAGEPDDDTTIIINFDEPEDMEIPSLVRNNTTLTFSVAGSGYSNFRWILDGNERSGSTTATITLYTISLSTGPHRMTVIANKGTAVYSQEIIFRVDR